MKPIVTAFVQVNKKSIRVELSPEDGKAYKNRIRNAMRARERELLEIEADRKARGYCPDCHTLCTKDHRCIRCGKYCPPATKTAATHKQTPKVTHVTNSDMNWGIIRVTI